MLNTCSETPMLTWFKVRIFFARRYEAFSTDPQEGSKLRLVASVEVQARNSEHACHAGFWSSALGGQLCKRSQWADNSVRAEESLERRALPFVFSSGRAEVEVVPRDREGVRFECRHLRCGVIYFHVLRVFDGDGDRRARRPLIPALGEPVYAA